MPSPTTLGAQVESGIEVLKFTAGGSSRCRAIVAACGTAGSLATATSGMFRGSATTTLGGQPRAWVRTVPGIKHCFASLPQELAGPIAGLPQPVPLELVDSSGGGQTPRRWLVAWFGQVSSEPDTVEISEGFAERIGLSNGTWLRIRVRKDLPVAKQALVAVTEGDWDVIGMNQGSAEFGDVLSQIGVMEVGASYPLWIAGRTLIHLECRSVEPAHAAKLVAGITDLVVAPPPPREVAKTDDASSCTVRIVPLDAERGRASGALIPGSSGLHHWDGSVAFANPATRAALGLPGGSAEAGGARLVRVIPRAIPETTNPKDGVKPKTLPRVSVVELSDDASVPKDHIMVAPCVLGTLGIEPMQRVLLRPSEAPAMGGAGTVSVDFSQCVDARNKGNGIAAEDALKIMQEHALAMRSRSRPEGEGTHQSGGMGGRWEGAGAIVLHAGSIVHVCDLDRGCDAIYRIHRVSATFQEVGVGAGVGAGEQEKGPVILDRKAFAGTFAFAQKKRIGRDPPSQRAPAWVEAWDSPWMASGYAQCLPILKHCFDGRVRERLKKLNLHPLGGVLIHGPTGSGKSVLCSAICAKLEASEDMVKPVWISCESLAKENTQSVKKAIQMAFAMAIECRPSVVVLDNLSAILNANESSHEVTEQWHATVIAEYIADCIEKLKSAPSGEGHSVAIIASVKSIDDVQNTLKRSGCLDHHVAMPAPNARDKTDIFLKLAASRDFAVDEEAEDFIESHCEGYDVADLNALVDLCYHGILSGILRKTNASYIKERTLLVSRSDVERVFNAYVPGRSRDISRTTEGEEGGKKAWSDLRGMDDARQELEDVLGFASKFKFIVQKCPLRLRTGALLYGPPGCGKTFLVRSAAQICNLRMISIKGPELLNKYIGASEAAVRDLFQRASAASPCILFFDEFDAIAPKRGHDSTGVTDRVVNQFLAELDGIESLVGVFVLAATSRPDLIDSALLRPGRLDRLIFCRFPGRAERLEILAHAAKTLKLGPGCDETLDRIAASTEGFSGADLIALLSEAELVAAKQVMMNATDGHDAPSDLPCITKSDLESALEKSGPSLGLQERQRLQGIYRHFDQKKSVLENGNSEPAAYATQRVSHA